ncbi:MAG: hypothetical protein AAB295_11190, partial [Chloroflexota bacterium]
MEVLRAVTISLFPVGASTTLVYAHHARSAHLLPSALADLLSRCQAFASLADHARQRCRELRLADAQAESVTSQLATLAASGLLISRRELLDRCVARSTVDAPPPIASVGVLTRDRVESLQRALVSYVENSRRHTRANDFIVVDDSERADARSRTRAMLKAVQSHHDAPISYASREEKEQLARALIDETHLPVDVVRFALFGDDACGSTIGANRNALLLATAGDMVFSADDDTVCRVARAADSRDALALVSGADPTEFRLYPDRDAAARSASHVDTDLLAVHERLLGRSLASCVAAAREAGEPDLDQMGPRLFQSLESGDGRVLVTMNGLVGDSGMGSPRYFLALQGPSRERLVASEAAYTAAFESRAVVRAARRPTICDAPFCMTGFVGLDARGLLPPFFPVQRNSDGIFALTLRTCFADGYFGFLPWTLLHAPAEKRSFTADDLWRKSEGLRTADVLLACIGACEAGSATLSDGERLRGLGRRLTALGSLEPGEFEEFLRLQLWRRAAAYAAALETLLRVHGESPRFWADDVKRTLDTLRVYAGAAHPH